MGKRGGDDTVDVGGIQLTRIELTDDQVAYRAVWPDGYEVMGRGDLMLVYEDELARPLLIKTLEDSRSRLESQ